MTSALTRRQFLQRAGSGAGALAAAGSAGSFLTACSHDGLAPVVPDPHPDVVVVGAGAFGGWTALHLQEMGARVTLVDRYGPGNFLSTSGDETRGIRAAYGERQQWTEWASRAIERWTAFDREWGDTFGGPLFHSAGDLILRPAWDSFLEATRQTFDRVGVRYEILTVQDVEDRWPWIRTQGMAAALFEPGAGIGRARRACEVVADVLVRKGGEVVLARAEPGRTRGGRLEEVALEPGGARAAEVFVFALGPWFPKALPDLMDARLSIPMGHVYYFQTPAGDARFMHPSMPSWNVPGVTGWPSLTVESRGFRVRVGGRDGGRDPDASSRQVPPEHEEAARAILHGHFPDLAGAPLLEARACHYELTPDREWIVDRHPRWRNVWIVGGGNAEGFKFGPVLGEYVAARILGEDPYPELAETFRL